MGLIKPRKNTGSGEIVVVEHTPAECLNNAFVKAPESLGNASTADVVKGKTFTSKNGVSLVGSHECSGGVEGLEPGHYGLEVTGTPENYNSEYIKVTGVLNESTEIEPSYSYEDYPITTYIPGQLKEHCSVTITSYVNDRTDVFYEGNTLNLAAKATETITCCPGGLVAIQTPTASSNVSVSNGTRVLGNASYGNKEIVVFRVQDGTKISVN